MTFNTIEQDVAAILEYNRTARADDMALYAAYVYEKMKNTDEFEKLQQAVENKDYTTKTKIINGWMINVFSDRRFRIAHGVAPYESVSRVRRMVQAKDESLKAPPEIVEEKKKIERNYRNYARGLNK